MTRRKTAHLRLRRGFAQSDSRIRCLPLDANVGIADAQNVGFAASRGEYISVMGQDDVSLPQRMQVQLEFLQSQPRVGAVGTLALNVDADLNTLHAYDVPPRHGQIVLNMFIGASLIAPTVMIRRKYLTAADGYEPGRRAADDLELYSRLLWTTDVKYANLSEMLLLRRVHKDAISSSREPKLIAQVAEVLERMLLRLWEEAPERTLDLVISHATAPTSQLVGAQNCKS